MLELERILFFYEVGQQLPDYREELFKGMS